MCGLFDAPKQPPPKVAKPAPFIFQSNDKANLKAKKAGTSNLTVDLNTGNSGSGASNGLSIP